MNRHDARICRILPLKHEVVSVSQSFSLSRVAGYLDRLQVVQIRTIFQRPPKVCLSVSVGSFVWPPSCNRCILSFLAISDSVYGFPVVVLPLLISTASCRGSARMSILLKNFVCVLLRGYQTLSASTVDCAFFGMLQANKTLSCSDCFAKFVQLNALLDCALIPRWTRWLRLLVSSLWWWTCRDTRLAIYQPKFASRSSAPRLCRCRLDTPGTRRWTWNELSSFETLCTACQQFPAAPLTQKNILPQLLLLLLLIPCTFENKTRCMIMSTVLQFPASPYRLSPFHIWECFLVLDSVSDNVLPAVSRGSFDTLLPAVSRASSNRPWIHLRIPWDFGNIRTTRRRLPFVQAC